MATYTNCPLCLIQSPNQVSKVDSTCSHCGRKMCSACECDCDATESPLNPEQLKYKKFPKRILNIVRQHMWEYEGVDGQTMADYMKFPISYILNFMIADEGRQMRRFMPKSYSKKKSKDTVDEIIKLCLE